MKPGFLLPLLLLFFSLPDPAGPLLLLGCAAAVPAFYFRRQRNTSPAEGTYAAAWVYDNVASPRERQAVLDRLSGTELATLLETCSELHQGAYRAPATLPCAEKAAFVVNELRRHRVEALKNGRDQEAVRRFVRAVEVNSPALPPARQALAEMTRLVSNDPDLVVQTLREWLLRPDCLKRFQAATKGAPALTDNLIRAYHLDLDQPSLSSAEEVSVVLSLMNPELREAYRSELPNLPSVSPTRADKEFVARKFVARAWSRMSVSYPSSTIN